MHTLIELSHVSKHYMNPGSGKRTPVLRDINLSVEKGETVAVVGPSGSGKSTLLNLMGALDQPSSGKVKIKGVDLSVLSENELASVRNRTIGFIFQLHHLLGQCTVFENVLEQYPNPSNGEKKILQQIARELLLMEGSDWPFLLYTNQAKEYANQRFHHHHQRFNKLLWVAKNFKEKKRISLQDLEEIESIDSCFKDINIDYFRKNS